MKRKEPIRVAVVGQVPPPIHGQAAMIQYFLEGEYREVELHHVKMAFSSDIRDVGLFRWRKMWHLAEVILKIWIVRVREKAVVLYYPPAGPNLVPFCRDCILLLATRFFFQKVVFHFHSAGISQLYPRLPWFLRMAFKLAYGRPDLSIRLSQLGPDDASFIESKRIAVIPNGIPDAAGAKGPGGNEEGEAPFSPQGDRAEVPVILFMGTLSEEKGVLILLEACSQLQKRGVPFICQVAGKADSDAFKDAVEAERQRLALCENVFLCGQVSGQDKWDLFRRADIFCFPTFYASESFGLVVVEAMQFGIPCVATRWRALPEIILEDKTGFLVQARDSLGLADRLETLLCNPALRRRMGDEGRRRYQDEYRIETFRDRMEKNLSVLFSPQGIAA